MYSFIIYQIYTFLLYIYIYIYIKKIMTVYIQRKSAQCTAIKYKINLQSIFFFFWLKKQEILNNIQFSSDKLE